MPLPVLLAAGLSLLSALRAEGPQLIPATPAELLGKWYIKRWAGDMPIPEQKKRHPLPPFTFAINALNKLEFRMNIMKPIGCRQFKMPLTEDQGEPGTLRTWWRHKITIGFLPGKDHAIASFKGRMDRANMQMMKLMGRTLDENPKALKVFEDFVESKGLNKTLIIDPPQAEACKLDGSS